MTELNIMDRKFLFLFILFAFGCENPNNPTVVEQNKPFLDTVFINLSSYIDKFNDKNINEILFKLRENYQEKFLVINFPPGIYSIEEGIFLHSNMVFQAYGAEFTMYEVPKNDGYFFIGKDIKNFKFIGGVLKGRRDIWPDSVNIRGFFIIGNSENITLENISIFDLSSNGIGIFGSKTTPIRFVIVRNVVIDNCSNKYNDYLEPSPGPVPGSNREDQGNIAFYYVEDFEVINCEFKNSKSDGTHFYKCSKGRIAKNKIIGSKMGGYFVETSNNIIGENNYIENNGSRGVTIERNSENNTFKNNIVKFSGREGLWGDDVVNLKVIGNIFILNGRKRDFWVSSNINITDSAWPHDVRNPKTRNILIYGNYIVTDTFQWVAIRIMSVAIDVIIEKNILTGNNRVIRPDSWLSGIGRVIVRRNIGWKTENQGIATLRGNGSDKVLKFNHGLDFHEPDDPSMLKYVKIFVILTPVSKDIGILLEEVKYDTRYIYLHFKNAPPIGEDIIFFWYAYVSYP
jgi:hypothetical protein